MEFDVNIYEHIEEIGEETWNRLSGGRPFTSYRWYRFCEKIQSDKSTYVVLSHHGEAIAYATFWLLVDESIENLIGGRVAEFLVESFFKVWPLLACRSLLGSASGLCVPEDPQLRDTALATFTEVGLDLAKHQRASFLMFDYVWEHETHWSWPECLGTAVVPEPETRLTIEWPDFESYLQHLSRKRRKHYRQHMKYTQEMGVEISMHSAVPDIEEAMALMRNVAGKYRAASFLATSRKFLENMDMIDAVWVAARIGEKLVGCEVMLGDNGGWYVTALGRDYDYPFVYFVLGYEDIRYAIEHGAKFLNWGSCTYEVKRRLGFKAVPNNYVLFAGNGPIFRPLGRVLAGMVREDTGAEDMEIAQPMARSEGEMEQE